MQREGLARVFCGKEMSALPASQPVSRLRQSAEVLRKSPPAPPCSQTPIPSKLCWSGKYIWRTHAKSSPKSQENRSASRAEHNLETRPHKPPCSLLCLVSCAAARLFSKIRFGLCRRTRYLGPRPQPQPGILQAQLAEDNDDGLSRSTRRNDR